MLWKQDILSPYMIPVGGRGKPRIPLSHLKIGYRTPMCCFKKNTEVDSILNRMGILFENSMFYLRHLVQRNESWNFTQK